MAGLLHFLARKVGLDSTKEDGSQDSNAKRLRPLEERDALRRAELTKGQVRNVTGDIIKFDEPVRTFETPPPVIDPTSANPFLERLVSLSKKDTARGELPGKNDTRLKLVNAIAPAIPDDRRVPHADTHNAFRDILNGKGMMQLNLSGKTYTLPDTKQNRKVMKELTLNWEDFADLTAHFDGKLLWIAGMLIDLGSAASALMDPSGTSQGKTALTVAIEGGPTLLKIGISIVQAAGTLVAGLKKKAEPAGEMLADIDRFPGVRRFCECVEFHYLVEEDGSSRCYLLFCGRYPGAEEYGVYDYRYLDHIRSSYEHTIRDDGMHVFKWTEDSVMFEITAKTTKRVVERVDMEIRERRKRPEKKRARFLIPRKKA